MARVTIRDLRNHGGRVLQQVARGETLTITRDGEPVAELRPLPRGGLTATTLLSRWRGLPPVQASSLRADIDAALDMTL